MKYCHTLPRAVEGRCEKVAEDLLGNQREPDLAEGVALMEERRFKHCIAGETSINVEPPPQHLVRRDAEATVHLNPIFCCTRGRASSLYRRMQEEYGVPIIDIFTDGKGDLNRLRIPRLCYLVGRKG